MKKLEFVISTKDEEGILAINTNNILSKELTIYYDIVNKLVTINGTGIFYSTK